MANWSLGCKGCQFIFFFREIGDTLVESFVADKPKFPPEGLECECPRCKARFTYTRHELIYRLSSTANSAADKHVSRRSY